MTRAFTHQYDSVPYRSGGRSSIVRRDSSTTRKPFLDMMMAREHTSISHCANASRLFSRAPSRLSRAPKSVAPPASCTPKVPAVAFIALVRNFGDTDDCRATESRWYEKVAQLINTGMRPATHFGTFSFFERHYNCASILAPFAAKSDLT